MIFNMVGGGAGGTGGGATLVVSSPANVSVTVSKDDKSYTKNSGSLGSTTFKGLATGTWTVTISGNGQTATRTIEITADYAITIAFFSASINITYPANSTCVVTNSNGQTVASDTNATSSTKTWTATVSATGTYTITATATDGSEKSKSQDISIASDGQSISVSLSYEYYVFKTGFGIASDWEVEWGAAAFANVNKTRIEIGSSSRDGSAAASAGSVAKYNTTQYTKINFDLNCDNLDGGNFYVGIANTNTDSSFVASKRISVTGKQTVTIDISKYNNNYYVKVYQDCWPSSQLIYNIWFE